MCGREGIRQFIRPGTTAGGGSRRHGTQVCVCVHLCVTFMCDGEGVSQFIRPGTTAGGGSRRHGTQVCVCVHLCVTLCVMEKALVNSLGLAQRQEEAAHAMARRCVYMICVFGCAFKDVV